MPHAPRSQKNLQNDALRRLRVPAAHRPPVLARAKLSGKIRELIDERAYLAVVVHVWWNNRDLYEWKKRNT